MSEIDNALNTLARKFSTFDDLKEMGNYYIEECKSALLEIIKGVKPDGMTADEYEKNITALFNGEN